MWLKGDTIFPLPLIVFIINKYIFYWVPNMCLLLSYWRYYYSFGTGIISETSFIYYKECSLSYGSSFMYTKYVKLQAGGPHASFK